MVDPPAPPPLPPFKPFEKALAPAPPPPPPFAVIPKIEESLPRTPCDGLPDEVPLPPPAPITIG